MLGSQQLPSVKHALNNARGDLQMGLGAVKLANRDATAVLLVATMADG